MRSNKKLMKQQKIIGWIQEQNMHKIRLPSILQIDTRPKAQIDDQSKPSIFLTNKEALVWIKKDMNRIDTKECMDLIKRRQQTMRLHRSPKQLSQRTMPLEGCKADKSLISKDNGFQSLRIHSQDNGHKKGQHAGKSSREQIYLYITSLCHGVCRNSEYLNLQKRRAKTEKNSNIIIQHSSKSKNQSQAKKKGMHNYQNISLNIEEGGKQCQLLEPW